MRQNYSSSIFRQAGLSLVEIMIALTIGLMIIGGVGYLYLGSRQAFRTQDNLTAIQENARFALETMTHDIRMAGYMGCGNLSAVTPHILAQNISAVSYATAVQVFPGGAGWTPPATITLKPNTDVLRISRAAGGGVNGTVPGGGNGSTLQISSNPYNFKKNDVLLVSDCSSADVFAVTNATSGGTTLTIGASNNVQPNKFSTAYGAGPPPAQVFKFYQTDYFIGCPSASYSGGKCSVPWALYQSVNGTPNPLIDNVEDVAYDLGVNATGANPQAVTTYLAPNQVTNWAQVLSVQIHLLLVGAASGDSDANVVGTPQLLTFNNAPWAAPDNRLYQEAVATVAIRNRL